MALIPPLASIPLSVVAYFAAFMITFTVSKASPDIASDEWGVNVPIFTMIRNPFLQPYPFHEDIQAERTLL